MDGVKRIDETSFDRNWVDHLNGALNVSTHTNTSWHFYSRSSSLSKIAADGEGESYSCIIPKPHVPGETAAARDGTSRGNGLPQGLALREFGRAKSNRLVVRGPSTCSVSGTGSASNGLNVPVHSGAGRGTFSVTSIPNSASPRRTLSNGDGVKRYSPSSASL
jgi:hypothetical protein